MSKKIDFDPFETYPDNIDITKPLLLVDLGYATFYRFNATKTWYKLAHPELKEELNSPDYKWFENKEFLSKFEKKYLDSLLELAKSKKVPQYNIIMCADCKSCDNWRNEYFEKYKYQRIEARKNGFDGKEVFKYANDVLFPVLCKNYGFKLLRIDNIEADDIAGTICKYMTTNYPKINVYIMATDKDYLQVTNDMIKLIDFKGKVLSEGVNGTEQLWYKMLIGDSSDNIPNVKFKRELVKPDSKSGAEYVGLSKDAVLKYCKDLPKFFKELELHPDLLDMNQFVVNQMIIDFDYIPDKNKKQVVKEFTKMIQ